MYNMKGIKTTRLRIVPQTAEQMEELSKQPQLDEHMKAALSEMYNGCKANPKEWFWYTNWQIYLADETCIGSLCFKGSPKNGAVEIGYGIDEKFRNQGYAAEAVKAIVGWAFTNPGVYFILAETERDNTASIRVLDKNGFTNFGEGSEGTRRIKERPNTSWIPVYIGIGIAMGAAISGASGRIAIGIGIGTCLGVAIGAVIDARGKAKRTKYKNLLK